jgi:hypothetical protein
VASRSNNFGVVLKGDFVGFFFALKRYVNNFGGFTFVGIDRVSNINIFKRSVTIGGEYRRTQSQRASIEDLLL